MICDEGKDKFKKLWTSLTKQNTPKFRNNNQPERYSVNSEILTDNSEEWNGIHDQFFDLSKEFEIPDRGRGKADIEVDFTILKI